ncbi:2-C-methyl-D-erythritol 2,4-cyclodiphosphate synthase [Anoxynatronum buryatiense]|uniref:2-C-methyl-D-erythritol 2,4-cyclodiphosphate synthase n=1 Tax=Anoxynatronum buryatiense TaxID=489973 RepID=A0AA45WYU2_9CLOT|nr:2-C-methyl-D-erythritol 2,4-cyclodiphosphate synthase [Anoxynatronum buryatiense]SMP69978.1 2-C-methyl-D-erythritol 2,4-cyclodiphosphate synthase [Anoxynatronum buryatiense]
MRIGNGFDVHALVTGRKLILGGVEIPHETGLAGHSDADVLTHAVMDALLGAAGLGDIGRHFPDDDPAYFNIDSLLLLKQVMNQLKQHGLMVEYVDAVIMAQRPKMAPHLDAMKQRLAETMGISESRLNLKATTTEKLGFVGREEGIAAQAVTLLKETVTAKTVQE